MRVGNMFDDFPRRWFDKPHNVHQLAHFLVSNRNYDAKEIIDYYERPWKWDDEWNEMQAERASKRLSRNKDIDPDTF